MDLLAFKSAMLEFVRLNDGWAPFLVGAVAFGESVAFLSLLTPATAILVGVGVLIGSAGLEFWPIWLGAALGAATGDTLSYWIGGRYKHAAFRIWPLSRHPDFVARGEHFFQRLGPWALFGGRFFGPARAVLPLIAGVFAMPIVLFQSVNVASASLWAFVLLAPGAGLAEHLSR